MYHCAECKKEVIVFQGNTIKACECDAPIVAEVEATMTGGGGLSN